MVRQALAGVLAQQPSVQVSAQARDAEEALSALSAQEIDVLILDYSMPGPDPAAVIERAARCSPETKVLVLTVHENVHYAVRVLEAGAHGYLIKSAAVEELVHAVHSVHAGETYVSRKLASRVLGHLRTPRRERAGLDALTPKEFEFTRLVSNGQGLKDCAAAMNVSTSTASTYRSRVLAKLGLHNTAELIRFGLEQGLGQNT